MTFKLLLRCLKNSVSGMYVYKNPWNSIPKICGLYAYVIVMKTSVGPGRGLLVPLPTMLSEGIWGQVSRAREEALEP